MAKGDQGGPEGQAGNEGARAVHRIEHPDEFGVRSILAVLLTNEAVVGKAGADRFADRRFGVLVGARDGIEGAVLHRALVFEAMVGAEQG